MKNIRLIIIKILTCIGIIAIGAILDCSGNVGLNPSAGVTDIGNPPSTIKGNKIDSVGYRPPTSF